MHPYPYLWRNFVKRRLRHLDRKQLNVRRVCPDGRKFRDDKKDCNAEICEVKEGKVNVES